VTSATRTIRRPPTWVYRALLVADGWHTWQWTLYGSAQTTPGDAVVGVQARTTRRWGWLRWSRRWKLVEASQDAVVMWRATDVLGGDVRWTLAADGDGTRVHVEDRRRWPDGPAAVRASLEGLAAMLEDGLTEPTGHHNALGDAAVQGTLGRDVRFDLRATPVHDRLIHIELDRRHAPCAMHCSFCPRTAVAAPRDLPPPSPTDIVRILDAARRLATQWPDVDVVLWSDDLLQFPAVLPLLDAFAGRRISIHTPGNRLGRPGLAEGLAARRIHLDVTVHATDADVWTAVAGNRGAMDALLSGLDVFAAAGGPFDLSVVVTDRNVDALAQTLIDLTRRYAPKRLSIRVFYPDASELGRSYGTQFPSYDRLISELAHAAATVALPPIQLANLPPCQVAPDALTGIEAVWTINRNALRTLDLPACGSCPARDVCCGVHPWYAAMFEVRPPRLEDVAALLSRHTAPTADAPTDDVRHLLRDDGLAELLVRPHEADRPAWLHGAAWAARYRIDPRLDDRERRAFETLLATAGDRLRGRPDLDDAAFATLAARIREAWRRRTSGLGD
jgi:hypothetical protein